MLDGLVHKVVAIVVQNVKDEHAGGGLAESQPLVLACATPKCKVVLAGFPPHTHTYAMFH